ncbi:hypothetical protein C8R42DRAFT_646758 [Lentinula raphanica]|nr:hypothetical protein C8R42DRAFT_646758 [Lentinula raphanica]
MPSSDMEASHSTGVAVDVAGSEVEQDWEMEDEVDLTNDQRLLKHWIREHMGVEELMAPGFKFFYVRCQEPSAPVRTKKCIYLQARSMLPQNTVLAAYHLTIPGFLYSKTPRFAFPVHELNPHISTAEARTELALPSIVPLMFLWAFNAFHGDRPILIDIPLVVGSKAKAVFTRIWTCCRRIRWNGLSVQTRYETQGIKNSFAWVDYHLLRRMDNDWFLHDVDGSDEAGLHTKWNIHWRLKSVYTPAYSPGERRNRILLEETALATGSTGAGPTRATTSYFQPTQSGTYHWNER